MQTHGELFTSSPRHNTRSRSSVPCKRAIFLCSDVSSLASPVPIDAPASSCTSSQRIHVQSVWKAFKGHCRSVCSEGKTPQRSGVIFSGEPFDFDRFSGKTMRLEYKSPSCPRCHKEFSSDYFAFAPGVVCGRSIGELLPVGVIEDIHHKRHRYFRQTESQYPQTTTPQRRKHSRLPFACVKLRASKPFRGSCFDEISSHPLLRPVQRNNSHRSKVAEKVGILTTISLQLPQRRSRPTAWQPQLQFRNSRCLGLSSASCLPIRNQALRLGTKQQCWC